MNIDPTQPWGLVIDYAGRATVTENGHTLSVRVYDNGLGYALERDPFTGQYPSVYVSAEFARTGAGDATLRGFGLAVVEARDGVPAVADPTAVQRAVAAALADFEARRAAYASLCATWDPGDEPTPEPEPEGQPGPSPATVPSSTSATSPTPNPTSPAPNP
ncbi:ATP-binding protein [Streptomyces sp. NPDC058667]|uniref:ATP-binding protein n=1 Tax=Streptomyces sp. NPDC058667 TaxID=3346588 RepID=UPI00364B780F